MHAEGFPPVADSRARVLVLGSLPGPVSLRERQYYAQPRNAFWGIMAVLFGAAPEQSYETRLESLRSHHVALWDVCASAHRPGALDAAIRRASVVPNDFVRFFAAHSELRLICFNGKAAADLYRRKVLPGLPEELQALQYETLPSTSPALAALTFEQKLEWWRVVREAVGDMQARNDFSPKKLLHTKWPAVAPRDPCPRPPGRKLEL